MALYETIWEESDIVKIMYLILFYLRTISCYLWKYQSEETYIKSIAFLTHSSQASIQRKI